jgi:hypothetical protein
MPRKQSLNGRAVQPVTGSDGNNGLRPRTPLGRRLLEIRRKIVASGQPLLDWNSIETELRARRGEPVQED